MPKTFAELLNKVTRQCIILLKFMKFELKLKFNPK
jgi:hypothetical protein